MENRIEKYLTQSSQSFLDRISHLHYEYIIVLVYICLTGRFIFNYKSILNCEHDKFHKVVVTIGILIYHFAIGVLDKESGEKQSALTICKTIWTFEGKIENPFPVNWIFGSTPINSKRKKVVKMVFIIRFLLEFVLSAFDTFKGGSNILK